MSISESNAREPGPSFSALTLQQFSVALTHCLDAKSGDRTGALSAAAERLCEEARAKHLRAEHIVFAVHRIWVTNAANHGLDPGRTSLAYQHVLNLCLDAYFRE